MYYYTILRVTLCHWGVFVSVWVTCATLCSDNGFSSACEPHWQQWGQRSGNRWRCSRRQRRHTHTHTHTERKAEQHTPQTVGLGGLMDQTQKLWRTGLFCGRWVQRSKPVACDWPVQSRAPPLRHQHHPHQFLFFIFHFPPPPIIVYTVIEYNSLHSNPLSQNVVFCI